MPKTPKLVPITTPPATEQNPRLVAHDQASHRFIIAVGTDRTAYDFSVRATRLPPLTANEPAPVVPLRKKKSARNPPPR